MIRHPRIARAHVAALVLALIAAACGGGAKPPATAPSATAAANAPAPAPVSTDPEDARLPLWSEVKHGQLANGLTYYILKHGKPEKRAFLWLAVNAGSVQEDDDQRGLAHFDEHMAFNGTRRFPKADIVNYLEKIGMRFGADLNARNTFDDTVYELEVPTDDKAFLDKGLDILHDWAGDATYDPAEVDKERGVVLEEWRLGRGAQQRMFDKQAPVLFKGSRYAVRLPIGLPEIIKTAPRELAQGDLGISIDVDDRFHFAPSQVIDGQTVTCSSVTTTATYTECDDLQQAGRYFPNGITCGPTWSSENSAFSDTAGFCASLTGNPAIQVFYICSDSILRSTWSNHVWGTVEDNGYTQHVRCFY